MAAPVETISDIAPLTRFRYASYPEIEWGLIEAQTIHWPSAPVKGGRIETQTIPAHLMHEWISASLFSGAANQLDHDIVWTNRDMHQRLGICQRLWKHS